MQALYGVIVASITDVDLKNSLPTFIACKVTLNDLFVENVPGLIGFHNMDFEKEVIILTSSSPNRKELHERNRKSDR